MQDSNIIAPSANAETAPVVAWVFNSGAEKTGTGQMQMRKTIAATMLLVLVGAMGCADINVDLGRWGKGDKDTDGTTSATPAKSAEKEMFQGHYITVWIDGEKTEPGGKDGSEQLWKVDDVSSNPKIKFELDTKKLGKFKQADVIVNPVKGGKVDQQVMYKCDAVAGMKPGKELQLKEFGWFHDRTYEKVTKIPPGKYRITVRVNSEGNWDRQYIMAEIK